MEDILPAARSNSDSTAYGKQLVGSNHLLDASHRPGVARHVLILLFTGWLWSTVAGLRSDAPRRLRIFLAFPLTNPVALIFFLRHDWRAARPALLCYLLAFAVLWGGGLAAETIEKRRMADYAAKLARAGESLAMESLIPEPVPSQSNLWLHPFLLPLAAANQRRAEAGGDRGPKPYQSMEVPKSDPRIEYPRENASAPVPV